MFIGLSLRVHVSVYAYMYVGCLCDPLSLACIYASLYRVKSYLYIRLRCVCNNCGCIHLGIYLTTAFLCSMYSCSPVTVIVTMHPSTFI